MCRVGIPTRNSITSSVEVLMGCLFKRRDNFARNVDRICYCYAIRNLNMDVAGDSGCGFDRDFDEASDDSNSCFSQSGSTNLTNMEICSTTEFPNYEKI